MILKINLFSSVYHPTLSDRGLLVFLEFINLRCHSSPPSCCYLLITQRMDHVSGWNTFSTQCRYHTCVTISDIGTRLLEFLYFSNVCYNPVCWMVLRSIWSIFSYSAFLQRTLITSQNNLTGHDIVYINSL